MNYQDDYYNRMTELQNKRLDLTADNNAFQNKLGMVNTALGVGTDLFNGVMNYKNFQLQKDSFNFNKDMATKNYQMAKKAFDWKMNRANNMQNNLDALNKKYGG